VEISKFNPAECRGWNQSLGCNLNVTPFGWNWTSGDYACFVLTTDAQASLAHRQHLGLSGRWEFALPMSAVPLRLDITLHSQVEL
jgi:hypothetical protein